MMISSRMMEQKLRALDDVMFHFLEFCGLVKKDGGKFEGGWGLYTPEQRPGSRGGFSDLGVGLEKNVSRF